MTYPQPPQQVKTIGQNKFASEAVLSRQFAYFSGVPLIRNLLDAMPGIVLVLNRNRQIVFSNRAFCDLAGYSSQKSLLGRLVGDVLACHVTHDLAANCGTGESCETCGALTAMISGLAGQKNVQECTITRKGGHTMQNLTLRIWSEPLRYAEDVFTVLAGIDISHERRRLALERTFFHDILNLVGSIRGFAELPEIDQKVDFHEISRRIKLASQRIIDEIDAQRVLLAVEKGQLKVDNCILNSKQVLVDVVELYEGQDIARNRTMQIDAVTVSFVSDATLLRRILGNMLKNALEASLQGDTVTLGADTSNSQLNLWVHNPAVIPDEYQQRIFQRDFSTKGTGRGLGTYSMQLLSRLLSGDVDFISETGNGTRFTLTLPIVSHEEQNGQNI
jgi:signal transduction histidine kinase